MKVHRFVTTISAVILVLLLSACEDDEYHARTQRLDLVEFIINNNGYSDKMVLDNGDTLNLNPRVGKPGSLLRDTVVRSVAVFVPNEGSYPQSVRVTSIGNVLTTYPLVYREIYAHPINVTSVWMGGNYLNVRLDIKSKGKGHTMGFANRGIQTHDDGSKTLHLMFYNNNGEDEEYFSRTVYASCVLKPAMNDLQKGRDSVAIQINETGKGFVEYKFKL